MTEFVQVSPDTGAPARPDAVVTDDFWNTHAWMPLALLLPLFFLIEWLDLDRVVAHALFYNAAADQWLGAGTGGWWARGLIHDGGRWLARSIAATALALWLASFVSAGARQWRRSAGFVFLAMVASIAIVGGPQNRDQCRLSLGPGRVRRRSSVRRLVRRPAGFVAARAVFSRRAFFVGLCAGVFLLRVP